MKPLMPPLNLVLSFVLALPWPAAAQQSACSLLTPGDIQAATGAPAGASHASDMVVPDGSTKGQTVQVCFWTVPTLQGQVVISTARLPANTTLAQALLSSNPGIDAMKAKHWTEERKDFPNAMCSILTPPASQREPMFLSSCSGVAHGMVLSIAFMSPTKKLTLDQVKTLLDKANARQG